MDLKPFISNASKWRKHFENSTKRMRSNRKFNVVQEGSGFPSNNIVSISPTTQTEQIAKSEMKQMNKLASPNKKIYKKRNNSNSTHKGRIVRRGKTKVNKNLKTKKKVLSHRKKRK